MSAIGMWLGRTILFLFMAVSIQVLQAQPPGRGGPPHEVRGGPPMRGSFSGPMSFLQRMDANGNGMLDPDESQGRARFFLDRIAQEAKLDLSKPVRLDKLAKAFEKMRERSREGFRGGSSRSSEDRGRGNDRGRTASAPDVEPLVPGFGEPDIFEPVPGFGTMGEKFSVKIEDLDRKEAQRTLARYDANHDGILDKAEISRGRWRNDPFSVDRNRDGKLSLNELALRYAMRRVDREGGSTKGRSSSSRSSPSRSSSSRGGSASSSNSRQEMMVRMMFSRYDRNGNGVLEKEEWKSFRTDPSAADTNHDGKITRDELGKWMVNRSGSRGGDRGSSGRSRWFSRRSEGDSKKGESVRSVSKASTSSDRKSYRLRTPVELLPEGLPEWFAQRDTNGDGQIMMFEFASSWSDAIVSDFAQFDLNHDGVITPQECLRATEAGAVLGSPSPVASSNGATSSTKTSSSSPTSRGSSSSTAASQGSPSTSSSRSSSASPAGTRNVSKKYIKYAVGYIRMYDTNHDNVLNKNEWSKMKKDYSSADTDGDGRITPLELAEHMTKL